MPSSFTSRLKLERQASGENSGTWGNLVNYVLNRVDASVKGYKAVDVAGSANVTLTSNNSTSNTDDSTTDDQVHNSILEFTGTLTANINVFTDAVETNYAVFNNTSGSFTLTFGPTGGTGVDIKQGTKTLVYTDGTTMYDITKDLGDIQVTGLTSNGNVSLKTSSTLKLEDDTGGEFVGLKANATTTSYTLTLPPTTGSADQVMATDGSGNLSFVDVSAGVDWDTTAKTASFTAVSGNGYFVNTTSGAITVTLPATPSAGDIVAFQDYAGTWAINNVTLARNGSNIGGSAIDATLSASNQSITLLYVDATRGWQTVNDSTQSIDGATYIAATGGTVTEDGDYKIHTFTGPGTFTVCSVGNPAGSTTVDYLLIAGGGGGGGANSPGGSPYGNGGGGGGGGYRESSGAASGCYTRSPLGACVAAVPVSASPGAYPIVVGGGAGSTPNCSRGSAGTPSTALGLTATGGGGGGGQNSPIAPGTAGGSGGGGGGASSGAGGAGNTPPVSPSQGNAGGSGSSQAGGGGGATTVGVNGTSGTGGGNGGTGGTSEINGFSFGRAGGGGGGTYGPGQPSGTGQCGGGPGGPGPGSTSVGPGQAGTANTGGGGGGGSTIGPDSGPAGGGGGGSGIVIIRYKYK